MADLDAAIREWLGPVPTVDQWGEWSRRTCTALLAALDRHSHNSAQIEDGADKVYKDGAFVMSRPGLVTRCAECGHVQPCPTKVDIAKALGVEVDRG
jgi:hypothetical protein